MVRWCQFYLDQLTSEILAIHYLEKYNISENGNDKQQRLLRR